MKFKNYRNSHTNEDVIYSRKNIADMSVREAFSRKDEIMSQYNSIGIPSEGELQSSPNVIWVDPYTREDGTEVRGHWRSKPERSLSNSQENEVKSGTQSENEQGNITGGASSLYEKKELDTGLSKENTQQDKNTKQEIDWNNLLKDDKITGAAAEVNSLTNNSSPWDSPFLPNSRNDDYNLKKELIRFNNEQNMNYKDAKDLMNIAIVGPENIEKNPEYKLINNSVLEEKLGYKLNRNLPTIEFDKNSSLAHAIGESKKFINSIKEWSSKSENERKDVISVTLDDNLNLFRSINNATVLNPEIKNGIFTGYLYDKYDFKLSKFKDMYTTVINTGAVTLQTVKFLKNYYIIVPIKLKLKKL